MLIIDYDPNDSRHSMPDSAIEDFVKQCCSSYNSSDKGDLFCDVSHMLVVDCFRVYVKEGVIDCKDIVFIYEGVRHFVNKDGRYLSDSFPYGMIDNFLNRLL